MGVFASLAAWILSSRERERVCSFLRIVFVLSLCPCNENIYYMLCLSSEVKHLHRISVKNLQHIIPIFKFNLAKQFFSRNNGDHHHHNTQIFKKKKEKSKLLFELIFFSIENRCLNAAAFE